MVREAPNTRLRSSRKPSHNHATFQLCKARVTNYCGGGGHAPWRGRADWKAAASQGHGRMAAESGRTHSSQLNRKNSRKFKFQIHCTFVP